MNPVNIDPFQSMYLTRTLIFWFQMQKTMTKQVKKKVQQMI